MWKSEKQFADLLTKQNRKWVYHPRHFDLHPHYRHYEPDFFLPNENLYIEVIGTRQAYLHNKNKYKLFKKLYPHIKFIIVDFGNTPYPYPKNFKERMVKNWYMKTKYISVSIRPDLHFQLKEFANIKGLKIQFLVDRAIRNFLVSKKVYKE